VRALVLTGLAISLIAPATAAQAEPSVGEIQKRIEKSSTELEKIVESYNKINEDLKATKAAAQALATKMKPLEEQLTRSSAEVADIAATAYKTGHASTANALLTGVTTDSFVDRLSTLQLLARDRQQQVAGFTETARRYEQQKQALATTEAKQSAQARELAGRKKKIQGDLKKLMELRRRAYGSATSPGSSYSGSIPAVAGSAGVAVRFGYGAIGSPYVWAGEGPGYDCSGFTLSAWRAAGRSLPHNAAMQWNVVAHISRSQLRAGDLVFYNGLQHVGLYVGGNKIIHAPTFGQSVQLASVDVMSPYGYGRVR
jgi:cell wall-associated NlpC family hydrolase